MVYVDEESPYMKLLAPFLEKKQVCGQNLPFRCPSESRKLDWIGLD